MCEDELGFKLAFQIKCHLKKTVLVYNFGLNVTFQET